VLDKLRILFDESDTSANGELDASELVEALYKYYKFNKMSRPRPKIEKEVSVAMETYDVDQSGALEFDEFVTMAMRSNTFKFAVDPAIKHRVVDLAKANAEAIGPF